MTVPTRIVIALLCTLSPIQGRADNWDDFALETCDGNGMIFGPVLTNVIIHTAAVSPVARYEWDDRGRAPIGYIKGMALCYARVYQKLKDGDPAAKEMAKARELDDSDDALTHYDPRFRRLGWDNSISGTNTLRHLFVLMLGLGMRESSGSFCEGRDMSSSDGGSNTAEAGLFQMSWNASIASNQIVRLFNLYSTDPAPEGYAKIFHEGVRCTEGQLRNWGSGRGRAYQALAKASPAFAVESAAVGLRNLKNHWGPIIRREAELLPSANTLFARIQDLVDKPEAEIAMMEIPYE